MKRSQVTVILSMLAVFASGALVGALAHRLYAVNSVIATQDPRPSPEHWRKQFVGEMKTRLQLDDAQLAKLNGIMDDTRERFKDLRVRMQPETERIRQDQRTQIRAMLNATQQAEYEKIVQEQHRKRKAGHKP